MIEYEQARGSFLTIILRYVCIQERALIRSGELFQRAISWRDAPSREHSVKGIRGWIVKYRKNNPFNSLLWSFFILLKDDIELNKHYCLKLYVFHNILTK